MNLQTPGYIRLLKRGDLQERAGRLQALFSACRLCPRNCGVDRTRGERGACGAPAIPRVARAVAHFGEEPPVSGTRGSGAVFFSYCNLRCCFCQNYQISQEARGREVSVGGLADMMLDLQQQGCHNINLVSPTHYLPAVAQALYLAAAGGLRIPIVYNSNGYENADVLRLLEGLVDIYLPDAKYGDDAPAEKYSGVRAYRLVNRKALREMFRQVGFLIQDSRGIAQRGLIVRHLVLPHGAAATEKVLATLRRDFGPRLAVSLMAQYAPCHNASRFPELAARVARDDYRRAVSTLEELGLEEGWVQEWESLDREFVPDFTKTDSWN